MTEPSDALAALARQIDIRRKTDTGLVARLRRCDPTVDAGRDALFETQAVLLAAGLDPAPAQLPAWTLIVHCLALVGGAHQSGLSTGEVLAQMGLKELRLRLLVEADEALLRELLPRLARRLAAGGHRVNWWPFANMLGLGRVEPDEARRELIRGYLRAAATTD